MSRDLTIRNDAFLKKALSLEKLIEGSNLSYGTMDGQDRMEKLRTIGDGPVVVFDQDHIGRGVQVTEISRKSLKLSLPLPATSYDIDALYLLAGRAAALWSRSRVEDPDNDRVISPSEMEEHRKADYRSNIEILSKLHSTPSEPVTLPCAFFPISIEGETLSSFASEKTYGGFARYLHERQETGAFFSCGIIASFPDRAGTTSIYVVIDQGVTILPYKPRDMYREGEESKECDNYLIAYKYRGSLLTMDYDAFTKKVPPERKSPFDATHWQLSAMDEEELASYML